MKRISIGTLAMFAFVVIVCGTLVIRAAFAQTPKLVPMQGHWSPVSVKITYRDGKTRTALLTGNVQSGNPRFYPDTHSITGKAEGDAQVSIWLDTLGAISRTSDRELTAVLKSGTERTLEIGLYDAFSLANDDGGSETVKIANCKKIEFLQPARKDGMGHAMFDQWRYSPFTGEKLPLKE